MDLNYRVDCTRNGFKIDTTQTKPVNLTSFVSKCNRQLTVNVDDDPPADGRWDVIVGNCRFQKKRRINAIEFESRTETALGLQMSSASKMHKEQQLTAQVGSHFGSRDLVEGQDFSLVDRNCFQWLDIYLKGKTHWIEIDLNSPNL